MLSIQNLSGGWITDCTGDGKPFSLDNVETICLCIIALERYSPI